MKKSFIAHLLAFCGIGSPQVIAQKPIASHADEITVATEEMMASYEAGNYADAEALARKVLALRERSDGPDHLDTVRPRNVLAWLCRNRKNYDEAALLYSRNLAIWEESHGHDDLETSAFLNNVGLTYSEWANTTPNTDAKTQKFEVARNALTRALNIRVNKAGPNHVLVGEALNNLALLSAYQRRFDEAENLLVRALQLDEARLGPNHPSTEQSRLNLEHIRYDRQALSVLNGADLRSVHSLTVEQARSLSGFTQHLDLESMTEITDGVAEALAQHKGLLLDLSGLTKLSVESAKALSQHEKGLILNGLASLSDDTAAALADHRGYVLCLNGLTSVSVNTAKSLSRHKGTLMLYSLTHLSSEAAAALARHKGPVIFYQLTDVPADGVLALSANPEIELPESLR